MLFCIFPSGKFDCIKVLSIYCYMLIMLCNGLKIGEYEVYWLKNFLITNVKAIH